MSQLLNGWSVSAIVVVATGQPYNANIINSTLGSAVPGDGGMTGAEVSTFASATGGRVSWLARNSFNLPNFTNVDFRMGRSLSFREKYRLNFVVDAFNLFNHTMVSGRKHNRVHILRARHRRVCRPHERMLVACSFIWEPVDDLGHAIRGAPVAVWRSFQLLSDSAGT